VPVHQYRSVPTRPPSTASTAPQRPAPAPLPPPPHAALSTVARQLKSHSPWRIRPGHSEPRIVGKRRPGVDCDGSRGNSVGAVTPGDPRFPIYQRRRYSTKINKATLALAKFEFALARQGFKFRVRVLFFLLSRALLSLLFPPSRVPKSIVV